MAELLTEDFLSTYPDFPPHMTELGMFVFLRTYSRFLTKEKRRETYKETCARATQYNVQLVIDHLKNIGYQIDATAMIQEAQMLFDNMYHMKQFLSGRTLWIGGTQAAKRCSLANFNCAALNITKWDDFCDLFYLLMVGTGVGFKSSRLLSSQMAKIRNNVNIIHSDYQALPKHDRLEQTQLVTLPNGFAKIYVGDSKEGWVESLRKYLKILSDPEYEYIHTIKISYNSVRPRGERLKTFGGTSSGPEPLKEMFEGIDRTLRSQLDPWIAPMTADDHGYVQVRPIHIMDIGNLIGQNVIVGGVRRTAEMFIFEENDYEVLFAKYGLNGFYRPEELEHHIQLGHDLEQYGIKPTWFDQLTTMFQKQGHASRTGLNHRHMSNNSIMFQQRPSLEYLKLLMKILRYEGEPGLINLEEMKRRRPNAELVNPCVSADTMVLTDQGPQSVADLIGQPFKAVVNGQCFPSTRKGFFKTGTKQLYLLKTNGGHQLRLTANHRVCVYRSERSWPSIHINQCEFVEASELKSTDSIVIDSYNSYNMLFDSFDSLTPDGTEDVYDCTIDQVHMFSANGIMVHNCGEILLDSCQTCNLTTVNLAEFVDLDSHGRPYLKEEELLNAQRLSARAGLRMTLVQLELPHWDDKQKRDRLIGTSLTGIKDTLDRLNYTKADEIHLIQKLGDAARQEATKYAKEIRIPAALLVTTIKPEGSLSQLVGGVSQGLHLSHSPFFIRRIRINSHDPMVDVVKTAHWRINPEVGTAGATYEEKMANARTYVVDFPVYTHAKKTKYQTTIEEQLDTYFTYQKIYADHNCSNTISVKNDEWDRLPQIIYDNWDKYLGITFIPLDGGHYELAPYEECSQEDYRQLKESMGEFDHQLLDTLDRQLCIDCDSSDDSTALPADETMKSECAGGICPLR